MDIKVTISEAQYFKDINNYSIYLSARDLQSDKLLNIVSAIPRKSYDKTYQDWEMPYSYLDILKRRIGEENRLIVEGQLPQDELDVRESLQFVTKPYEHQVEGVMYGLSHDSFLLGDEPGLGKTKQIIDLAIERRNRGVIKHCLIICGINGNKYNWLEEIKIHSGEEGWLLGTRELRDGSLREGSSQDKLDDLYQVPDNFFLITNIESLRGLAHKDGRHRVFPIAERINELCKSGTIGMIAFDEAHIGRNPESQQGQALLKITDCKYKIPMSGTFVLNNPLDLYLPLRWAGLENHSYWAYRDHYAVMGGFNNKQVVAFKYMDQLREILSKVMLRRTKEEVLDLPPKVYSTEYVEMYDDQRKLYNEVMLMIKKDLDKIRLSSDPLAQLLRLRQVTGCPEIVSSKITNSAKMDRLLEIVKDITDNGEKVIVYSQWTTVTDILREKLKEYNPAYITGEVSSDLRMKEVDKFQNDSSCKVIIGTIGAMGTGLTLTAATNVIFLDEPWNQAIKTQAEDRAHRVGTTSTVRIITLITKKTIDEVVYRIVKKKGKVSDFLVDGVPMQRNNELVSAIFGGTK